jgi:putative endonuclease
MLAGKGYRILERNWRCRLGEVDLIAEQNGELVFVEVRTRTGDRFGTAEESVDARKRMRLRRMALLYAAANNLDDPPIRFDVVAVQMDGKTNECRLRHVESAF